MLFSNWLAALKRRSFPQSNVRPRQAKPRLRFTTEFMELEDRSLLSTFVPTLVGTPGITSLSQVVATPADLPVKLVTIMNNSNDVVYPILFGANSTLDLTAGQVVRISLTNGGNGYTSTPTVSITGGGGTGAAATAVIDGLGHVVALNLSSPGAGYTSTPTVSFSGGGGSGATANAPISNLQPDSPQTSLYDPLDTYNQSYRGYIGEFNQSTSSVELGLQPGHQLTLQVPLVFWDGGRLFFASNGSQPLQSATDPGNPLQNNNTWHFAPTAVSYIVSADQPDPVSSIANANGRVMWYHDATPHDFGTDGPGQLAEWSIRDPLQPNFAPNMASSQVQTIFNYDVSYVDNLTFPAAMEITNVPTQLPPGYNGPAIAPASYAALGTDLTVAQMQEAMALFTSTTPGVNNPDLGTYFAGRGYDKFYLPGGPNGFDFQKLPAGYNLFAVAPGADAASQYDNNKYQLVSGGNRAQIDTHGTGIVTKDSPIITNVDPEWAAQLVAGMLTTNIGSTEFKKGTYIVSVVGTTITMSSPALGNGPAGMSYTFVGSQFTSSAGTTDGTTATITGLDANVGIYLRPGMLVTGPGITNYNTILSISSDYKSVTLTGTAPSAASGAYAFTGAPASYADTTLINNWYSWADYYVNNVNATVQTSTGSTHGTGSPTDDNALKLDGLSPSVISQLKVGQVVNGPGIPVNPDPSDSTRNTTIAAIDLLTNTVRLSNPVLTAETGTYTFSPPVLIARSSDAQPYTISFATGTQAQRDTALAFSQSVYDVMQGWSKLSEPSYLSQSALLLNYVIGGNIGTFALQAGKSLPTIRLNQLRDELKSVLRGVADFSKTPEFDASGHEQWYPDPAVGTPNAKLTPFGGGTPADATFGVYNLNPYVWFIHIKLGMSGYGFSLDDDTSNAQDAANSIQVAFGGTASTATGDSQHLDNEELYTFGAPFGTLHDQGHIDTTSGIAKGYDLTQFPIISGLSLATVAKLKAFDPFSGLGALVTGFGMTPTPGSSRVFLVGPANPVNGVNTSYVVLKQPSPAQDGPTGPYTFSGFDTTLPVITSFTPASGAVGTQVTLTGSGFTKAKGVTFNGFPATAYTVNSDTSITATVPTGVTSGKIGVRGPAGTGYSTTDFAVSLGATFQSSFPGTGELGAPWVMRVGSFTTTPSTATAGTGPHNLYTYRGSATDNVSVSVNVDKIESGETAGLVARYAGPGLANFYTAGIKNLNGTYSAVIRKNVDGVFTKLGTPVSLTLEQFDGSGTITFDVVGRSLRLFVNGELIATATDTTFTSGAVGIWGSAGTQFSGTFGASAIVLQDATLPFRDDFDPTPDDQLSTYWTNRSGNFTVQNGQAVAAGTAASINKALLNGVTADDVTLSMNVNTLGANESVWLVGRHVSSTMYFAGITADATGNSFTAQIYKRVDGVESPIGPSQTVNFTPGDRMTFKLSGTSLSLTVGSNPPLVVTDTSIIAGGRVGIRANGGVAISTFTAETP